MRVTIVGGGIAGLTCALGLHAAGFEPRVMEAARTIEARSPRTTNSDPLDPATVAFPFARTGERRRSGVPPWQKRQLSAHAVAGAGSPGQTHEALARWSCATGRGRPRCGPEHPG
ncbi:NAD(P)-binding protein [Streptomyces sp. NPDC088252]|uniref:NAD(P)-binding protein n=1 Tax=Streptomyces sp. NPDC088252 TaxID=3365845 RepID=UPI0038183046